MTASRQQWRASKVTERLSRPTTETQAIKPAEDAELAITDQTRHVDRCFQLLADRRRRFCLYHLHRADSPLPIRDLAVLVEASVTPSESSLTELVVDEAVLQLHHVHLPKLHDAGLVETSDGHVELSATPTIQDWLAMTATVELDVVRDQGGP